MGERSLRLGLLEGDGSVCERWGTGVGLGLWSKEPGCWGSGAGSGVSWDKCPLWDKRPSCGMCPVYQVMGRPQFLKVDLCGKGMKSNRSDLGSPRKC